MKQGKLGNHFMKLGINLEVLQDLNLSSPDLLRLYESK